MMMMMIMMNSSRAASSKDRKHGRHLEHPYSIGGSRIFYRGGGDFGNPSERSERTLSGSGLRPTGVVASPGFGSRRGTKRHRNNLSRTHNNNMK